MAVSGSRGTHFIVRTRITRMNGQQSVIVRRPEEERERERGKRSRLRSLNDENDYHTMTPTATASPLSDTGLKISTTPQRELLTWRFAREFWSINSNLRCSSTSVGLVYDALTHPECRRVVIVIQETFLSPTWSRDVYRFTSRYLQDRSDKSP